MGTKIKKNKPDMITVLHKHRTSVGHLYDAVDDSLKKLREHQQSEEPEEIKQSKWDRRFGAKETEAGMVTKMIAAYGKIIPMEEKVNKSLLREHKRRYKSREARKLDDDDRELMRSFIAAEAHRRKHGIGVSEGWYRKRVENPLYPRKIGKVDNDVDRNPENWEYLPDTRGLEPCHGGPGLLYGIKDPEAWERCEESPPADSEYWKKGLDFPPNYYRDTVNIAHERELSRQRGEWVDGKARFEEVDNRRVVPIYLVGYGPTDDLTPEEYYKERDKAQQGNEASGATSESQDADTQEATATNDENVTQDEGGDVVSPPENQSTSAQEETATNNENVGQGSAITVTPRNLNEDAQASQ